MKKYLPLLAAALALTGDGRVLVTDGYVQQDGYPADAYSLIDLDAYLLRQHRLHPGTDVGTVGAAYMPPEDFP